MHFKSLPESDENGSEKSREIQNMINETLFRDNALKLNQILHLQLSNLIWLIDLDKLQRNGNEAIDSIFTLCEIETHLPT